MDKKSIRLNSVLFWVSICIAFILIPLLIFSHSSTYYKMRFDNYDVYEEFENYSIEKDEVDVNIDNLVSHLSIMSSSLNNDFYSKEDILHLYDVKGILEALYLILPFSMISIFWTFNRRIRIDHKLMKNLSRGYIIILLITFIIVYALFDNFFILAHKLTFSNDYWLLNPETSNLIKFFPQNLFLEVFIITITINFLLHISFIMLIRKIYGKRKSK